MSIDSTITSIKIKNKPFFMFKHHQKMAIALVGDPSKFFMDKGGLGIEIIANFLFYLKIS